MAVHLSIGRIRFVPLAVPLAVSLAALVGLAVVAGAVYLPIHPGPEVEPASAVAESVFGTRQAPAEVKTETASINLGGLDAVRAIKPLVEQRCPDAEYSDFEVAEIIKIGGVKYRGTFIQLASEIQDLLTPMAREILANAMQLWPGGGARLDKILLSGGGANMLGRWLVEQIEHNEVEIVENSVFANANGFYKFAKYYQLSGK